MDSFGRAHKLASFAGRHSLLTDRTSGARKRECEVERTCNAKTDELTWDDRIRDQQAGFSMLEVTMVMAISLVILGMSVIKLQPLYQQVQANSALQEVKETLREGRELAISQRRTIVVKFSGGNTMQFFQVTEPANTVSTTAFLTLPLPGQAQFLTYTGEIDTPDGFGIPTSGGIEFGGSSGTPTTGVEFQSDGTFTDGNGTPINGTIFLGLPNVPTSARAVTILGNTGRIKPYHYTGSAWNQ
jgi:prepilin-type N-terminal cleavage/methylation domain-containing protein